ncbi:chemotaxis protein CheV [Motiliproteus coralliicola]|uniref:Chemotaxis protein CheV n=1 Tax=Motiliproteus coralliicola TaxID=2283196 RepID=A0A369WUT1_9GAMM|nr:chemotaxis protein CheV [Motiliproteus coralliicola]RDE24314.1 chemotaxis protein CheV [Motiliproteus coralliicola]
MSGILDSVDQRTQLVGQNRFELLLFRLGRHQLFAINVFKVKEVLKLPRLNAIPNSHPVVIGVANMRGQTVPVIDLSAAIGMRPTEITETAHMIVTEYNGTVQGFLVSDVERILNLDWSDVMPPPVTAGRAHYLTAITRLEDNRLVEIVDVEKVLAEVSPYTTEITPGLIEDEVLAIAQSCEVMVVDDSQTARDQVHSTLSNLGIQIYEAVNGTDALQQLRAFAEHTDGSLSDRFLMVITDAEMPEMDGYRLTTEIRADDRLKDLYIVLHTSLSGSFNHAMVEKVGCNDFLPKFESDRLAKLVKDRIKVVYNL